MTKADYMRLQSTETCKCSDNQNPMKPLWKRREFWAVNSLVAIWALVFTFLIFTFSRLNPPREFYHHAYSMISFVVEAEGNETLTMTGPADTAGVLKQKAVSWNLQLGRLTKYTNNSDSGIAEAWANITAPPGKSWFKKKPSNYSSAVLTQNSWPDQGSEICS